jgi:hypothetical protein
VIFVGTFRIRAQLEIAVKQPSLTEPNWRLPGGCPGRQALRAGGKRGQDSFDDAPKVRILRRSVTYFRDLLAVFAFEAIGAGAFGWEPF